jgi:four helix bundle protein
MATFKRFEDIKAWQKARTVTAAVYETTAAERFARDFGLRDQIRRASVSIMANIAEGFGRYSDKEFANFLSIAHASVSEVQSHLYVALDLNYINATGFEQIYKELDEISRMTLMLAKHLRGSPGTKNSAVPTPDSRL